MSTQALRLKTLPTRSCSPRRFSHSESESGVKTDSASCRARSSSCLRAPVCRCGASRHPLARRSRPQTHAASEFDHEDLHTKDDATEGWVTIPCECAFSDGTNTMLPLDSKSPYEIRGEDRKYMFYLGDAREGPATAQLAVAQRRQGEGAI